MMTTMMKKSTRQTSFLLLTCLLLLSSHTSAFTVTPTPFPSQRPSSTSTTFLRMATTFTPTREKTNTDRKTSRQRPWAEPDNDVGQRRSRPIMEPGVIGGPLEYLQDDPNVSREPNDPFHILLLGMTYENPRVTVPYVAGTLGYVLLMPEDDAMEHAEFAKEEGMSVLGTWPREECLDLGAQLVVRDLVCRVVPGTPAGRQGWQAKGDASVWDVPSISDWE